MTERTTRLAGAVGYGVTGAAVALMAQAALNQPRPGEAQRNRELVARSFSAWADGTGSPFDLLADDASWTITGHSAVAKTYPSRAAFMTEVIRPFDARMASRLVPTLRRLYADGDTVIALFDAAGTARDGLPYANNYAWFLEMHRGRIVSAQAFFDSLAFDDLWHRVPATDTPS